jgi:hypothetical protein
MKSSNQMSGAPLNLYVPFGSYRVSIHADA